MATCFCLSASGRLSCLIHKTSYCSHARHAQSGSIRWLGSLRSNSVIKLLSVLFGKCTTLVVTKCWPITRLPCGDQWKAEKLGAIWRWPITRCFVKSDRAGLIIDHSINFRLNGEHWRVIAITAMHLITFFSHRRWNDMTKMATHTHYTMYGYEVNTVYN